MKIRELKFFFWIWLCAALAACSYSKEKEPALDLPPLGNYLASELTFRSVYARVIRPSCVGCHGNGGGINLESYANVKASLGRIYDAAIQKRTMPKAPNAPLSREDLGLLNAWIRSGAPEIAPGEDPGQPPPPLEAKFDSIKFHILEPKCVSCHAPGKPVGRIPLVTKEDLLNSPLDLVLPGNPDESGIMLSIRGVNPEKIMPPLKDADGKPTGFSKLTDQEIETVSAWIKNGAKD